MVAVWGRTGRVHLVSLRIYEILRRRAIKPKVLGLFEPGTMRSRPGFTQVIL